MAKTLEQQIADAQSKLARLREKERRKDTRQKIIIGGMLIAEALANQAAAKKMLGLIEAKVTRDMDKADVAPLVTRLQEIAG